MVDILRGKATKLENVREIKISRSFPKRNYSLRLDKELCNGCGVCAEICPKEAIKENGAIVVKGHIAKKPFVFFDSNACILCGECAVLCPLSALKMDVDGDEISTIAKNEAFPLLVKEFVVTNMKCRPDCGLKCKEECPTKAIRVLTENSEEGRISNIVEVRIDKSHCIYCRRCELACPYGAIEVKKPFQGTIELNKNLCPEGCVACEEACPTHAISVDEKPVVSPEFCVFCSACQKVCPEKAIKVKRKQISHTEIKAAAWLTALKKLTSVETVAKELQVKSVQKRFTRIRDIKGHRDSKPS